MLEIDLPGVSIGMKCLRGWLQQGLRAQTLPWSEPKVEKCGLWALCGQYGIAGYAGRYMVVDRHMMPVGSWEDPDSYMGIMPAITKAEALEKAYRESQEAKSKNGQSETAAS